MLHLCLWSKCYCYCTPAFKRHILTQLSHCGHSFLFCPSISLFSASSFTSSLPAPEQGSRTPHKSLKHFKHTWAALGTHSIPAPPLCEIPRLIEEEECDPLTRDDGWEGVKGGQYNTEQVNVYTFHWHIPQKCPT